MATKLVKQEETQQLPALSESNPLATAMAVAVELAKSDIIPKDFQNKPANCLIAVELANRLKASPFQVMQSMDVIYGRPSLRSSFIIACINQSGKLKGALKFSGDATSCQAWGIEKETGEKLIGPKVTLDMAQAEGWLTKNGSKWKTMPSLMLRYRAATFFGRLYCPEILNGMVTEDEVQDLVQPTENDITDVFMDEVDVTAPPEQDVTAESLAAAAEYYEEQYATDEQ